MKKFVLPFFFSLFCLVENEGIAQKVKKSQKASLSQTIAKTEITITYFRPVARDRALFGDLVAYDKVWQPGANNATIFEVTQDINIQGSPLKAGKYSLWAIPGEKQWTIIFSNKWDAWHTKYPKNDDALRVQAKSTEGMHMETLAYYFPYIEGKEGTLHFHWGKTIVPLNISTN